MILILGGTNEGKVISDALKTLGLKHQLSVATSLGMKTYGDETTDCIVARFTEEALCAHIGESNIVLVVDATHPNALEIKNVAKMACARMSIDYIRFSRSRVVTNIDDNSRIQVFDSMAELIGELKRKALPSDRFLITGIKHISDFYDVFHKSQCYFRTMPSTYSMTICEAHAVPLDHIIAIKAPCPIEVNLALIKSFGITHFIFKDSGEGSAFLSNLEAVEKSEIKGLVLSALLSESQDGLYDINTLINIINKKYGGQAC